MSTTDNLNIALIGCGGIATGKHVPGILATPGTRIVGLCDTNEGRIDTLLAAISKLDHPRFNEVEVAPRFPHCTRMLSEIGGEIDVIVICTPNSSHAPIAIAMMAEGKHIVCEKPMAENAENAENAIAMCAAAQKYNRRLHIGYQNRFRRDSLFAKAMAEAGEFGLYEYANALAIRRCAVPTWGVFLDKEAQGGGPLIDIGTHALDLALWITGDCKPRFVSAMAYQGKGKAPIIGNPWGAWDAEQYQFEDAVIGTVITETGMTVNLTASWIAHTLDSEEAIVNIWGSEASINMQRGLQVMQNWHGEMTTTRIELDPSGVAFYDPSFQKKPYELETQSWVSAITNGTDLVVKPKEALVVSVILDAMYRSAAQGGRQIELDMDHIMTKVAALAAA